MKVSEQRRALAAAVEAAQAAGRLMRQNVHAAKTSHFQSQHDIKLELDVRCQKLIQGRLRKALPESAFLGEEGVAGDPQAPLRWVVDPIDGTVNFTYGIPHAAVSISLQQLPADELDSAAGTCPGAPYVTLLGAIYDPFCNELWTAIRGQPARLNGRVVHVSQRQRLEEAVISLGFGNSPAAVDHTSRMWRRLARRVRKLRLMGSAALAFAYVATGRLDGFVEAGLKLWDITAGGLIVECAGGSFWHRPLPGDYAYDVDVNNGRLMEELRRVCRGSRGG